MERDWLKSFYKECGREVSLAYDVLNQTNNWAITLIIAVLATGFIGSIRFDNNDTLKFVYPTIYHWTFIIVAWVINMRFFVRSALALVNMYRWNTLINSTMKVLSLPENHPSSSIFKDNLSKKIESYYFKWNSPIKTRKLFWENLRLIYLWLFLIIIALFIIGLILLEKNLFYFIGLGFFIAATAYEVINFLFYRAFKYVEVPEIINPDILKLWDNTINDEKIIINSNEIIVFGFCQNGPYKFATDLLVNPDVKWLPWSYHLENIHPEFISAFFSNYSLSNRRVAFATWDINESGKKEVIRFGMIDHFVFDKGIIRITVKLENITTSNFKIIVNKSNALLFKSILELS